MAGKITDDPKLEAKGKAEKIAGKVQEKIGQVKQDSERRGVFEVKEFKKQQ